MAVNTPILQYIQEYCPESGPGAEKYRNAYNRLSKKREISKAKLRQIFSTLTADEQFAVLCFFSRCRDRSCVPLLFREVHSHDPHIRGAAAAGLAVIGGPDILSRLITMMHETDCCELRATLLSSLAHIQHVEASYRLIDHLVAISTDAHETCTCRSLAAEGLSNALDKLDRRKRAYKKGVGALMIALGDSSPEVRCSSAFALGDLKERRALPALQRLKMVDHATCEGIGPVSEAAADAIHSIRARTV